MQFDYFELEKLKAEMWAIADRERYEEPLTESESKLMYIFDCLNTKKSTEENIENFFEVLGELIEFKKGGV